MANELTKLRRENKELRRENKELRAEIERTTEELDALKRAISEGQLVPLSDYDEQADVAGKVTDMFVSAARRQRRGPSKKAAKAVDHHHRAQVIYDEERSKPRTSKALARRRTVKRLEKLHSADDAVHVYSEEGLRKILTG